MRIWTVANQKGGVGKTTSAVSLGGLASGEGQRVLLVDLDPHGSMTSYFGHNPDEMSSSVFTLFENPSAICEATIAQLLQPTDYENLVFLPASTALATLERRVIAKDGMGLVISRVLSALEGEFDLAIIDSPPVLGMLLINALAACERLIIPVQTEFLALKGLERIVHTLRMLSQSQHKQLNYVVVPTMFDRRTHASTSTLREIRHRYGCDTWPGKIPIDTKFREASKQGVPPHYFDAETHGVVAYASLLRWLNNTYEEGAKASYWEAS